VEKKGKERGEEGGRGNEVSGNINHERRTMIGEI